MDDVEPLKITLTSDQVIRLTGAASWLFGFMEGAGRSIPPHVAEAFQPIEIASSDIVRTYLQENPDNA